MGIPPPPPVEPITTAIFVGVIATSVLIAIINNETEKEAQRKKDEDRRRQDEARRRQEKERRKQEEARRKQEEARRKQEAIRKQKEEEEESYEYEEKRRERQFYRSEERSSNRHESNEWWWETNNDVSRFSPFTRPRNDSCACGYCYLEPPRDDGIFSSFDTNDYCMCGLCSPKETPQSRNYRYFSSENEERNERKCNCQRCNPKVEAEWNFKNSNYNNRNTSSSSGYTAKPNATPTNLSTGNRRTTQNNPSRSTAASGSSSQPPQPNQNNKKDEQNNEDIEWLNKFLKLLKAILDRCKCPLMLRNRILGFFKNFGKHQDNFKRLLEDITIQGIKEDELLSIVIKLFMSDAFAKDVTYGNFISLMEFVAKYIKDEAKFIMAAEDEKGENKLPFEQQLSKNIKKVIERSDILTSITKLFKEIRKAIVDDNTARLLELDFSGIFTKVYHYFKHRVVRGKVLTVKEYFDWIRKLIPLVKSLRPEYVELTDPTHERREILFEMYVTVYLGYVRIVVRVYGTRVNICTVFVREKKDKNAKDGDKYVDGKKRQ